MGDYRAPKTRRQLREYYFFCLHHVREYNKNWNFCAGMDTQTIEREIRNDTVWRRPTWPFNGSAKHGRDWFDDNLDILEDILDNDDRTHAKPKKPVRQIDPTIAIAMKVMNLTAPLTLTALKSRYKDLVKRHHPDANNGDKSAEDRLKTINEAYATLKKFTARPSL
ncbi:MAG: J domain-containing protein [Alphaproteobacteria bacterium]|nr:J domain-containing protein [Alphaproteobacteria bacterium]